MYIVYLQKMTVESRERVVHHRNLGLKKPAVRTQSIPRVPSPSPLSICELARSHGASAQGCYIGISSWFIEAGKGAGAEEKLSSFKQRAKNGWMRR